MCHFFVTHGRSVFTAMLTADVQILSHIWVGLAVPNLAELEVAKQPSQQGEAAMTSFNPRFLRLPCV
jgi:hypothetical protein